MAFDERLARTLAVMADAGADIAVLSTVNAMSYVGGYEAPIEVGPSPFAGGPSTLVVSREGHITLIASNAEQPQPGETRANSVSAYPGLSSVAHPDSLVDLYLKAVAHAIPSIRGLTVAVESDAIPAILGEQLRGHRLVDITDGLVRARATKTAEEIEHLRECARLVAVGQRAARDAAKPGRSELEIFARVRCAIETANGSRLALGGDLLSGPARTAEVMGWPTNRRVGPGDPLLCDLVPRHRGYWGDGCTTFCIGAPSPGFELLFRACQEALSQAEAILRPGVVAGVLDSELRAVLRGHGFEDPIHMGHAIGVAIHEYPRVVQGETARLEEDMVLMIEPCVRNESLGAVRLESMFRVTRGGNELMSTYDFSL